MSIKKPFVELINFLETNENKKVSSILDQVREMASGKSLSKTFILDESGEVKAIFCYYHKQWEVVADVPYGSKASSSTGLNTMCKLGTSLWTKQNKKVKEASQTVLELLESGDIEPADISEMKERLIAEAKEIDETDMPIGYSTLEELEAATGIKPIEE